MKRLQEYLEIIIKKNVKHIYFYKDICDVLLSLDHDKLYSVLPFLDKDCYFNYFAYNFREKLYKKLNNKEELFRLFNSNIFEEFKNNVFLTEKEKQFLGKLYDKIRLSYNFELENFVLDRKIINCKTDLLDQKYANFKHKIQLCDGNIYELKDVMFKYIKGKKYDSKTVNFLEKKYSKELKICKYYLRKPQN